MIALPSDYKEFIQLLFNKIMLLYDAIITYSCNPNNSTRKI